MEWSGGGKLLNIDYLTLLFYNMGDNIWLMSHDGLRSELMKVITQNQELKDEKSTHPNSFSRWSIIIASLIFSFSAYTMLHLYSIVHWKIILNGGTPLEDKTKECAFMLLGTLMWLRLIFVVLAVIYAVLSYTQGLRLGSIIASIFAVLAILTIFIMM